MFGGEGASAWFAVAASMATLAIGLSGCLGQDQRPSWPIFAQETARYEILDSEGTLRGSAEVTIEILGDDIVAHTTVAVAGMTPAAGRFRFAADSGQLLQVDQGQRTVFPWGINSYMPTGNEALQFGLTSENALRAATPIGPQWAMLERGVGALDVQWGEIQVSGGVFDNQWSLAASGPCQVQCGRAVGQSQVDLQMAGAMGGLLPAEAIYGYESSDDRLVLLRVDHGYSGDRVFLRPRAPMVVASPQRVSLCGHLPCEPPNWPDRLSLQRGYAAMAVSPQWALWSAEHPGMVPFVADVADSGRVGVLGSPLAGVGQWFFGFLDNGTAGEFFLASAEPMEGVGSPPVVTSYQERATALYPMNQTWGEPVVPMDIAIENFLRQAAKEGGDLRRLTFATLAKDNFPDERGRIIWALYFGQPTDLVAFGSAVTGQLLSLEYGPVSAGA